ncbi:MAG: type II secretion system F family protein, partial [Candidatus Binatia bacterium]
MASGKNKAFRLRSNQHKAIKADDVIAFFQQLSTLLVAGTPLLHSLQVAGQQSESEKFTPILKLVAARVASGNTLCAALTEHPKVFEETWIEMIKAGES